jgi:hypothetical protein
MSVWGVAALLLPLLALALPEPEVVCGYLAGACSAVMVTMLWFWVVQETGTAPRMRGDIAERQTAAELRRLGRRGWRLINHFMRENRDIDHVVLGPGGALVVSTKWSATPWKLDPPDDRVTMAAEQAASDARVIGGFLSRCHVDPVPVPVPVLVLWGPVSELPARIHQRTGTVVICGRAGLRAWLATLPNNVDGPTVERAWADLAEQVARRDTRADPLPRTAGSMMTRAFAAIGAAIAAFLVVAEVAAVTSILPVTLAAPAAAIGLGQMAVRRPRLRALAAGWLVGSVAAAAVVAAAVVVATVG